MSSKHVGIEEARKRLGDLVTAVQQGTDVVLTRNGKPAVRLVAIQEPTMPISIAIVQKGSRVRNPWKRMDTMQERHPSLTRHPQVVYIRNQMREGEALIAAEGPVRLWELECRDRWVIDPDPTTYPTADEAFGTLGRVADAPVTIAGLTVPADLTAVALAATAKVAEGAGLARLNDYVTQDFRVCDGLATVPFTGTGELRVAFGLAASPTGGVRCRPSTLAERLGWLHYSGINDTDYGRESGADCRWYALTWSGLAALAASQTHRELARRIHAEVTAACEEWMRREDPAPGGYPYKTVAAEAMRLLAEVQRAGGWADA